MSTTAALVALACGAIGKQQDQTAPGKVGADRALPASVERALQNVGPAVLAALTINLAVGSRGLGEVEFIEVAALIVAGLVTVWRRNLIWTFVVGMATIWMLGALT